MDEMIRVVVRGLKGVGMADEMGYIYQSNPPCEVPKILTPIQAMKADARAVCLDWAVTGDDIAAAAEESRELAHG